VGISAQENQIWLAALKRNSDSIESGLATFLGKSLINAACQMIALLYRS
jgi:hypothetical protein